MKLFENSRREKVLVLVGVLVFGFYFMEIFFVKKFAENENVDSSANEAFVETESQKVSEGKLESKKNRFEYEEVINEFFGNDKFRVRKDDVVFLEEPKVDVGTLKEGDIEDIILGVVTEGEYEGYILKNLNYVGIYSDGRVMLYLENPINKLKIFDSRSKSSYIFDEVIFNNYAIKDFEIEAFESIDEMYLNEFDLVVERAGLYYDGDLESSNGDLLGKGPTFELRFPGGTYQKYFYSLEYESGVKYLLNEEGEDVGLMENYKAFTGEGCGAWGTFTEERFTYPYISDDKFDVTNLSFIGSYNGWDYFEPIELKEIVTSEDSYEVRFVDAMWSAYHASFPGNSLSFDEFVEKKPVIFGQDPFGNYVILVLDYITESRDKPGHECNWIISEEIELGREIRGVEDRYEESKWF